MKKVEGGHHGGAWKIALADLMTALMAFFLLMWLLGATSEAQRKSIADYFKPTPKSLVQMGQLAGSNGVLGGRSIMDPEGLPVAASQTSLLDLEPPRDPESGKERGPGSEADEKAGKGPNDKPLDEEAKQKIAAEIDQKNFDQLEKELRKKLEESSALASLRIVRDREGLRIEVIDKSDFSMFALGTTRLLPRAQALIEEIAKSIAAMPNRIAVRGHTDSVPFSGGGMRNNWSLSAERADATRQLLVGAGVAPDRFARIEGVADTDPFISNDPSDPRNRRISVTLSYSDAAGGGAR